jgi:hypothetical protein
VLACGLVAFVIASLATPAIRLTMAIALLFALLATGLAIVGLLLFIVLVTKQGEKR